MTVRWETASKAEKTSLALIISSLSIMWLGTMFETTLDLGLRIIYSGMILLLGSVIFSLGYVVDWDK